MTKFPLTPARKRLKYCRRLWRLNVRMGGRIFIVWRKICLRQGRRKLRHWQRWGVIHTTKSLKWKTRCMKCFRRQKRWVVLAAYRQKRYLLKRNRRWLGCGDSPIKIWLIRWKIWNKSLQRWDYYPVIGWLRWKRIQNRWIMRWGEKHAGSKWK